MVPKKGPPLWLGLAHHEFKNSIEKLKKMKSASKLHIMHPEKIPLHCLWH